MLRLSFYTGGIAETNGWLLETSIGAVVFDAPEGITDWLGEQQIKPIALVLTHQHFDHVLDAQRIKDEHGCPIYAFAPYSKDLTLESLLPAAASMGFGVMPYVVDHLLEGQASMSLAGIEWQIFHIPGHSPDSLCFHSAEHEVVFAGDVLFAGSVGRTDFPGGSGERLLAGIARRLLTLPDQVRVFPGHGPETTIGTERAENPYLQGLSRRPV
jgi:glyoxylase-like metal-dependent hydrolase (beta-lactamase superfamily II)